MRANRRLESGLILLVLLTGVLISACSTEERTETAAGMRLYVFDCGYLLIKNLEPFSLGNNLQGPRQLANTCFLVRHPRGSLMWDAGLSDRLFNNPRERRNMRLEVRKTLAGQLREIGVDPGQIDYIAFSHLHFDHVGNAGLFSNARWLIQKQEYAAAFSETGRQQGFARKYYEPLRNNPVTLLEGEHDVFGDGKVRIIGAPGHTIGHQVLWLELENHGPLLLSGDLYHFAENRRLQAFPEFNYSARLTLDSMQRIEKLVLDTGAQMIIQHDAEQSAGLSRAPGWLD